MAFNRPADVKPRVALAARKPVFHRKDEHRNMSKPVSERLADGIPQIRSAITTLRVEFGFAPWRWIVKCRQPTSCSFSSTIAGVAQLKLMTGRWVKRYPPILYHNIALY